MTLGVETSTGLFWPNPMEREPLPAELDADVDFVCVEDTVELESVVLDPTCELVLPPNWVNTATETIATATTAATKVSRFAAELVMDCP